METPLGFGDERVGRTASPGCAIATPGFVVLGRKIRAPCVEAESIDDGANASLVSARERFPDV